VVHFSPNQIRVSLPEASPADVLVLNMHHRPGWHAEVSAGAQGQEDLSVRPLGRLISAQVPAGAREVTFWYRPPGLLAGLGLCSVTIGLLTLCWWRRRDEGDDDEVLAP
jgi:hypothetical protein